MSKDKLIGRENEYNKLIKCYNSNKNEFVVVYGRRRVGKTFLINQTFDNSFCFKFTGSYQQTKAIQLKKFIDELNIVSNTQYEYTSNWDTALLYLRKYIESLPNDVKQVIFFDELSWIDTNKSGFLSAFEYFYNHYLSAKDNVLLIICGSSTSWFTNKIFSNKGGLFNRLTARIYLEPFTIKETEEFLQSKNIFWSRYDICQTYMIMGGIPYYLNTLSSDLSFNQNIDNVFFKKHSELHDEFRFLYETIFGNHNYNLVVEALSTKKIGLSMKELSEITNLPLCGELSKILNNLVDCGFISKNQFLGNSKKDSLYQLSDFYTLFYFNFLKDKTNDEHYFSNTIDNPSRRNWFGHTFEILVKRHISQVKQKLGISGIQSSEYTWYTKNNTNNAQIDLLIDRRDNVINLCEIKFSINKFEIDKSYYENIINKIETLRSYINNKTAIQTILITTNGLANSKYNNICTKEVVLDDLFI